MPWMVGIVCTEAWEGEGIATSVLTVVAAVAEAAATLLGVVR